MPGKPVLHKFPVDIPVRQRRTWKNISTPLVLHVHVADRAPLSVLAMRDNANVKTSNTFTQEFFRRVAERLPLFRRVNSV